MRVHCSATVVMFLSILYMFESAQVAAATASGTNQWYTYPTSFPLHFVCESTTSIAGWFQFGASWYQADLSKPQTFAQAALTCQEQGAFLVSVNSTEEGQMVSQLVGNSVAWIGASQTALSMVTGESAGHKSNPLVPVPRGGRRCGSRYARSYPRGERRA